MEEQLALQRKMQERFTELKTRNPYYTLRSFSRKLNLNSGAVSGIMNGKRRVSVKIASRIADSLMLDPQERANLLGLFPKKGGRRAERTVRADATKFVQLQADQFKVMSDWYHFAILSLTRVEGFQSDVEWIAARLGITPTLARDAIERLKRLDLLEFASDGTFTRKPLSFKTSDDVADVSVRKAHHQYLDLARASLDRDPVTLRDFTAYTLAIDPAKLPRAKELIRQLREEVCDVLQDGPKKAVYEFCIQLFPVSSSGGQS